MYHRWQCDNLPRRNNRLLVTQPLLFFLWFPCVGVRLVYWSPRSTATFVICFHWYLLLAFSLHFSSSSAFLRSLFTQSSHLNCGLPRFLKPSCFFVSDLFGNWSSFILTMCPAHLIWLLTILPTMQPLLVTYLKGVTWQPKERHHYRHMLPWQFTSYTHVDAITSGGNTKSPKWETSSSIPMQVSVKEILMS